MADRKPQHKPPLSEAHKQLGAELRHIRKAAGKSTREVGTYTSGHISQVENGRETPSVEVVEEYARLGGDRARLLTALNDLKLQSEQKKQEARLARRGEELDMAQLTPQSDFMELRRGYRIDLMDDYYHIGADRVVNTMAHFVRIHALTPHTRFFVLSYGYEVDPRLGVLRVEPTSACELVRFEETQSGSINFVLEIDRSQPTVDADTFEFSYQILVNSDVPTKPMLRSGSRSGVSRCVKRAQFSPDDLPIKVWWFREPELLASDNDPDPNHLLALNSAGSYYREFINVHREFYGVAWLWEK